jgi:hypothetical protein
MARRGYCLPGNILMYWLRLSRSPRAAEMRLQSCRFAIPFVGLFAMVQAFAQSALEIPQPNSTQSGISIVSGWHCNASRVEVAFDGGERILVAYGTTRAVTKGPCGDDNNGFSLLWAYNLLGSGSHEVVAYADGVEFGRAAFVVTDISDRGFLRDKSADVRVGVFPDFEHDVILEWQEANQNFVISDYLPSRDPYNVAGMWEMTDGCCRREHGVAVREPLQVKIA